jgi:HSP20 family protein
MLMRTNQFRELDRFTPQVPGTPARPAGMPMDAWRDGDEFIVEFDLPGVSVDSLDLDIENNVVTVRAKRVPVDPPRELLAAERPCGLFSRQLVFGNNLDTTRISADYNDGVLRLVIPVAERAKPRKITVSRTSAIAKDTTAIPKNGSPVHINRARATEPVSA